MTAICIIGGGAAGMAAAISAAEADPSLHVTILEKKNQLGKKILATGNGRCNLSNTACAGYAQTLDFFADLGLMTRTDPSGRIYPYTEEARAVRDALDQKIRYLGIEVLLNAEAASLDKGEQGFFIHLENRDVFAHKLLLACGGKAGSAFGSTGDGFRFARTLGHRINKPVPVLTAVDVREDFSRMAGLRAKGAVSLYFQDRRIFCEEGEIQFTASGLSGICVFNLSRFLLIPEGKRFPDGFDDYRITIDFFPDRDRQAVEALLKEKKKNGAEGRKLLQFLVRRPVGDQIFAAAGDDISKTAALLKAFPCTPKSVKGWDFAQVTKGGVPLEEINMETMESRIVKNLYFAGEVIDYDGPCGGYNLQNAWETGIKAGKEMAK